MTRPREGTGRGRGPGVPSYPSVYKNCSRTPARARLDPGGSVPSSQGDRSGCSGSRDPTRPRPLGRDPLGPPTDTRHGNEDPVFDSVREFKSSRKQANSGGVPERFGGQEGPPAGRRKIPRPERPRRVPATPECHTPTRPNRNTFRKTSAAAEDEIAVPGDVLFFSVDTFRDYLFHASMK